MRVILAGIALWFLASAFLIFAVGAFLWLLRKFSPLHKVEGAGWARLTAFGLLMPPSSGIAFAIAGLTSALLCPSTVTRNYHLCLHSARHFCGHTASSNVLRSQFALWSTLLWLGLASATLGLAVRRHRYIKRIEPSHKLRQAIAKANLPSNLPVWETNADIPVGLVGLISPSIFVSQDLVRRLPLSALTVVLRHEYAHLARRDHWVRFLLFAIALIFAPVPFTLWLQREWKSASEKAADEFAARDEKSASLLAFAFKVFQSIWIPKSQEQIANRVNRLKGKRRKNFGESLLFAALICILAFCALVFYFPPLWLTLHCLAEALILK
ncbi:MAG: hypothetical protein NZ805_15220 [Armatimonadetes bacterium]|nr:hypothetical protein [Armatimonadota bacterium]MDW8029919.1 M56 family metallopeptidase [Armatimonadota bacterium]